MQAVDCLYCQNNKSCPLMAAYCLEVVYAMVEGADAPDCQQFIPVYRHGVEGVFRVYQPSNIARGN